MGSRGRREATLNPAQLGLVRLGRRMNAHHENGSAALRPKLTGNIAMACLRTYAPSDRARVQDAPLVDGSST